MDDTAPPRAVGKNDEDMGKALELLRLLWGEEYLFGHDPDRGWWVTKNGRIGSLLTAGSPEELARLLGEAEGTTW